MTVELYGGPHDGGERTVSPGATMLAIPVDDDNPYRVCQYEFRNTEENQKRLAAGQPVFFKYTGVWNLPKPDGGD
jgi:hypothetical protein